MSCCRLTAYQASRAARFPDHDLDRPSTPLLVDTRGRRLAAHLMRYLIERLYTRAGIRARIPAGAVVQALRHTFSTDAIQTGADIVELQPLLGHASLDTTRRYLDASAEGLRDVFKGHPSQIALREHLRKHGRRPPSSTFDAAGGHLLPLKITVAVPHWI